MNKVLITGISGFIGTYLSKEFKRNNWFVIGVDVILNDFVECDQFFQINILSDELDQVFTKHKNINCCIHTAGRASVPQSMTDPLGDFNANTTSTYRLLEVIRLHNPSTRFLLLSSAAVYGNPDKLPVTEKAEIAPLSPYGYNKYLAEEVCQMYYNLYKVNIDILRIFSAYGEGLQRQVIWDICWKARYEPEIKLMGTGNESRDFIHASDIANACVYICTNTAPGINIYNLAFGEEIIISDLAKLIVQNISPQKRIIFDNNLPSGSPSIWKADISKLKQIGYSPTIHIEKGIERVISWFNTKAI